MISYFTFNLSKCELEFSNLAVLFDAIQVDAFKKMSVLVEQISKNLKTAILFEILPL